MAGLERGTVLRELTDDDVGDVVSAAVDGAAPRDVMPPDTEDADETVWTPGRRRSYAAFLRSRLRPLPDGRREASYAVVADHVVVGVARLLPAAVGGDVEVGVWLVRSARGRGTGHDVLRHLIALARDGGGRRLVAHTTAGNAAAVRVLMRGGARVTQPVEHPGAVEAEIDLWSTRDHPRAPPPHGPGGDDLGCHGTWSRTSADR